MSHSCTDASAGNTMISTAAPAMSDCSQASTRERMLACLDDIDLVARALLENVLSGRGHSQEVSGSGAAAATVASLSCSFEQLTQLLLKRDADLHSLADVARQQQHVHKHMEQLRERVDQHDCVLNDLQRSLKDAETRLANAIYQANQKLDSIRRSQQRPVKADELIRYAHRISSTDAVSAPLLWQQGDPRRPYPTEMEMRRGLLGRLADTTGGIGLEATLRHTEALAQHHTANIQQSHTCISAPPAVSSGAPGQFRWNHGGGEVHMSVAGGGSVQVSKSVGGQQHDVEVMSTDSSSSSSSDSQ